MVPEPLVVPRFRHSDTPIEDLMKRRRSLARRPAGPQSVMFLHPAFALRPEINKLLLNSSC
jgi:hypothetical protein